MDAVLNFSYGAGNSLVNLHGHCRDDSCITNRITLLTDVDEAASRR